MVLKPQILFYTAMHGRHEIVEIMMEGLESIKEEWEDQADFDLHVVASTDEDIKFLQHRKIPYCTASNDQLGRKFSDGCEWTLGLDWDYMVLLGSDDILHPDLFAYYLYEMNQGADYFGVNECVFLHPNTKQAKLCNYRKNGKVGTIGAGRVFSRKLVEDCNGRLWPNNINQGLDMMSNMRIEAKGYKCQVVNPITPMVFDIKSDVNIWKFDQIRSSKSEEVDYHTVLDQLPERCRNLIYERFEGQDIQRAI